MKIFVSHASNDEDVYNRIFNILSEMGHEVLHAIDINIGESWIDKFKRTLQKTDFLIAVITENFLNSKWAQAELSSVVFGENNTHILPIIIGDVFVPSYIANIFSIKVDCIEGITQTVLKNSILFKGIDSDTVNNKFSIYDDNSNDVIEKISLLKDALKDNRLTLVCGAGISISSSIPSWNELLVNILNDVFSNETASSKVPASELLSIMPQSNLILGKYLQFLLKNDFEKIVQKHLYKNYNSGLGDNDIHQSEMMKAITDIARPRRTGQRLEAIITFNFDEIVERSLAANGIEYCSIWKEGQSYSPEELPIYHVHGFLPNTEQIDEPNLVFSEDAYHSQFIDPYSWANITQLNAYSSNVCLFIGLSLSDPNLRRLLDISWRRNNNRKHYIIMKKTANSAIDKIAAMLFEQDAASLGLNVIWCSSYSEIPELLQSINK